MRLLPRLPMLKLSTKLSAYPRRHSRAMQARSKWTRAVRPSFLFDSRMCTTREVMLSVTFPESMPNHTAWTNMHLVGSYNGTGLLDASGHSGSARSDRPIHDTVHPLGWDGMGHGHHRVRRYPQTRASGDLNRVSSEIWIPERLSATFIPA